MNMKMRTKTSKSVITSVVLALMMAFVMMPGMAFTATATEKTIIIDPLTETVYVGDVITMHATVSPEVDPYHVEWSSSDTSVATISKKKAELQGVSVGTTTITAKLLSGTDTEENSTSLGAATMDVTVVKNEEYGFQGTGGQTIKLTKPSDITVKEIQKDAAERVTKYVNKIEKPIASENGGYEFEFTMSAGMNNFNPDVFQESSLSHIKILNADGNVVASPAYGGYDADSKTIKLNVADTALSSGSSYVLEFGAKVQGNNSDKTLGVPVTFEFTTEELTPPADTAVLDEVKNVRAQANKPNQAAVSWEPVNGASGYELWRAGAQNGKYQKLYAGKAVKYTDKGLKSKESYYYKVRVFQTVDGKPIYSAFSKETSVKIKAKTPELTAKPGKRQIGLSWSKISDADKYELRRANSKNGTYRIISDKAKTSYVDKGLKSNAKYYYKVRAYRTEKGSKIYGPYSKILTVKVQPQEISKLTAKAGKKKVKLSWSKVSGADKYELWRAEKKNGPYVKVGVIKKQNWTDTKVKAKKTYYYKARAYYMEKGKKIYGSYTVVKKVRTK